LQPESETDILNLALDMKVSVSPVTIRGESQWMVSWTPPGGKRVRHYHPTKGSAEAEQASVIAQQKQAGNVWMTLLASERNTLITLFKEATDKGCTLRQAWDWFHANEWLTRVDTAELIVLLKDVEQRGCVVTQVVKLLRKAVDFYRENGQVANATIGEAYQQFITELEGQLVDGKSMRAYKSNVGRFVASREGVQLLTIKREEVLNWLTRPDWGPSTFNTYLTSLNSFFLWCVKTKKIKESPSATIRKIKRERMPSFDKPPVVLSLLQTARLLKAALDLDPGLIPYIVVGLFGGLRPEKESGRLQPEDINVDQMRIHVRGSHAKDRQQRYVEIHPLLKLWLDLGGDIPPNNLRKRFELVRERAGLIQRVKQEGRQRLQIIQTGWAQDCLRHTFASHYRPVFGDDRTIKQLGHGDYSMLFGHYAKLVTPEEAAKYWTVTPDYIRQGNFEDLLNPAAPSSAEPHPPVSA
jgi:integrase